MKTRGIKQIIGNFLYRAKYYLLDKLSEDVMDEFMAGQELENEIRAIVTIKKPDYIGRSQWEFKHDGHIIQAPILDLEWLEQFQSRSINIRPGDALIVSLKVICQYGIGSEVLKKLYKITQIHSVQYPQQEPVLNI